MALLVVLTAVLGVLGVLGSRGPTLAPDLETPRVPVPGWELTPSTVGLSGAGVDRSTLRVFHGAVRSGSTISRVKITSTLDLSLLKDITLDRVWLAPVGGRVALVLGATTVVKDSDIDGSAMQRGERIGVAGRVAGSYELSGLSITGMSVGAWLDGTGCGSMSDTYIRDMTSIGGTHVDGFTRRSGTGPLRIVRTRIDASGPDVTGAFFLQSTWGDPIGGVTVQDSYLEGEGYVIGLDSRGQGPWVRMLNVRVRSTGWGPISTTGGPL
ncbi:MAG: hypothetical protein WCD35_10520, partial [Mycobacteriales bacterium]